MDTKPTSVMLGALLLSSSLTTFHAAAKQSLDHVLPAGTRVTHTAEAPVLPSAIGDLTTKAAILRMTAAEHARIARGFSNLASGNKSGLQGLAGHHRKLATRYAQAAVAYDRQIAMQRSQETPAAVRHVANPG